MKVFDQGSACSSSDDCCLTPEQQATLLHIVYNPETDRVETDVPFMATLDSLWLGDQHVLSSAGPTVMFRNQSNGHNFSPLGQGFLDHTIPINQGPAGLTPPIVLENFTDMFNALASLTPDFSSVNSQRFQTFSFAPVPSWDFGFQYYTAMKLFAGEEIHYNIVDTDSGIKIYSQHFHVENDIEVDDLVDWFFDHPILFAFFNFQTEVYIERLDGTEVNWDRRPSNEAPTFPWVASKTRLFDTQIIASQTYVNDAIANIPGGGGDFDKVLTHNLNSVGRIPYDFDTFGGHLPSGPTVVIDKSGNIVRSR